MDATWEVSLSVAETSRQVVRSDVRTRDLPAAMDEARERVSRGEFFGIREPAILVIRSDETPERRRERRDAAFYKFDKAGRRRRVKKVDPIEKEWIAWAKRERQAVTAARSAKKLGVKGNCDECGGRWSVEGERRGLVHMCGYGLIPQEAFDGCSLSTLH